LKRIVDLLLLVASALMACVVMLGAYLFVKIYHYSPLWIFFSFLSILIVVGIREEYRQEFRSPQFLFFILGCLVINIVVIVVVATFFGWVYLIPALFLEQIVFYMLVDRLFGVKPSRRRQS
jgi:hypothetical protein